MSDPDRTEQRRRASSVSSMSDMCKLLSGAVKELEEVVSSAESTPESSPAPSPSIGRKNPSSQGSLPASPSVQRHLPPKLSAAKEPAKKAPGRLGAAKFGQFQKTAGNGPPPKQPGSSSPLVARKGSASELADAPEAPEGFEYRWGAALVASASSAVAERPKGCPDFELPKAPPAGFHYVYSLCLVHKH